MILILSQELDVTTNKVIDWLDYYKISYYRFNGSQLNFDNDISLDITNLSSKCYTNLPFDPKNISVVWYRRWGNYSSKETFSNEPNFKYLDETFLNYIRSEYKSVSYSFFSLFKDSYWLSDPPRHRNEDKFYYLKLAQKFNIKIPQSFVFNNLKSLTEVLKNEGSLITKSLFEASKIKIKDKSFIPYTSKIGLNDLNDLPERFFPTLFQKNIQKKYEIRSFYLDGEFYSMAIFSQGDKKTEVDFRRYNHQKPNRYIPYELPSTLISKLQNLLKNEGIVTCSIDIIKSTDNDYYFLEINQVGQFSMTSLPCNYNLEKIIAEFLIKKSKKNVKKQICN